MNVRLIKVTKSFLYPGLYYCDFQLKDFKMILKGVRYSTKTDYISMPTVKTEAKVHYSPYILYDLKERNAMFDEFKRLLKEIDFTNVKEERAPENKKAHVLIDLYNELEEFREQLARTAKRKKPFKASGKGYQKKDGPRAPSGAFTRHNPTGNNPEARPAFLGKGFSEVTLSRNRG